MQRLALLALIAAAVLNFLPTARAQATGANFAGGGLSVLRETSGDGCEKVGHCVACTSDERTKPYCAEGGGYKQQWLCARAGDEASVSGADIVVYRPCTGENSVALWAVAQFELFCLCGAAASLYVVRQRKNLAFAQFRGQVVGDRLSGGDNV